MKAVYKVLIRVLVAEFYRANAGFFLITAALLFGFLKSPQHLDIANFLAANPIYYLAPLGLWTLYALKTYFFVFRVKRMPQHLFLSNLVLLNAGQRKLCIVGVQVLLLIPVLGYAIFLGIIAFQANALESVGWIVLGNAMILLVTAHFVHLRLVQSVDHKSAHKFGSWTQKMPRKPGTLFIHHLFNRLPIPLLFTKLISITILIGASILFKNSQHDLRLLSLGMLLAATVNSTLSHRHVDFISNELRIFRNLPIGFLTKFLSIIATYLFMMIPEIIVLAGNNFEIINLIYLLKTISLFLGLIMFYHSISQAKNMNMEQFIKYVFFISATLFFVILGYIDPIIIGSLLFISSLLLLYQYDRPRDVFSQA